VLSDELITRLDQENIAIRADSELFQNLPINWQKLGRKT
jgi:hypothetical protein